MPSYNVHSILGSLFGVGTSDPKARVHVAGGIDLPQLRIDNVANSPALSMDEDGVLHCHIELHVSGSIVLKAGERMYFDGG